MAHLWRYKGNFYLPSYKKDSDKRKLVKGIFPCILLGSTTKTIASYIKNKLPAKDHKLMNEMNEFCFDNGKMESVTITFNV